MSKKNRKKTNKEKKNHRIPIYFDPVKEAGELALLEYCRVISGLDMTIPNYIKFMAIELALKIQENSRETDDGRGDTNVQEQIDSGPGDGDDTGGVSEEYEPAVEGTSGQG